MTASAPLPAAADPRRTALSNWLHTLPATLALDVASLRPASDDASFRRYFRLNLNDASGRTLIAVDAPPQHENLKAFIDIAQQLRAGGVHAPEIFAADLPQGYALLSDLGPLTYAATLAGPPAAEPARVDALYQQALDSLVLIQRLPTDQGVPAYDRRLLKAEIDLFPQWYVARHAQATLSEAEQSALDALCTLLCDQALAQSQVFVHRDYHSRNLLTPINDSAPGVIDFQDAVVGAVSYDLVSLLRDAYQDFSEAQQIDWAARYWERARDAKIAVPADFGQFWEHFESMGLQRHLKVLGIFARLNYRDGKARYLADLPRVLAYVRAVAQRYRAYRPLLALLDRLEASPVQAQER